MESDAIQFILETPQNHVGTKKRPRLVTSCDNCRLKKIKCNQTAPESKCEACKASRISCRFRDRERYFAERSRAIAGPNSGVYATELKQQPQETSPASYNISSGSSSPSAPRSNSHSPKASGMVSAETDVPSRYQAPYSPTTSHHHHNMGGSHHAQSSSISSFDSMRSSDSVSYNPYAPQPISQPDYPSNNGRHPNSYPQVPNARLLAFFEYDGGQRPKRDYMPHLIEVFFDQHEVKYPFLNRDEVIANFYNNQLPPMLANAIGAMAVQYTPLGDLTPADLFNLAQSYIEAARNVYSTTPGGAHPSFETLHALMLMSWFEHDRSRTRGFTTYFNMSMAMGQSLGLNNTAYWASQSDYEQSRRHDTMQGLNLLHEAHARLARPVARAPTRPI